MGKIFDKLKPFYIVYRYRVPSVIRKAVSLLVTCWVLTPLRTEILTRNNRTSIFLFTGNEKYTGVDFKSLIISNRSMARYLASIIYAGNPEIKEIGQVSLCDTKLISNFFPQADLILAETNMLRAHTQFFPIDSFIILPKLVCFTLDLSDTLETIFSKLNRRRRRSIRTIKKFGYSYEITHDQAKFNMFYHKMYYPHIIKRYRELATPESFVYLKQLFKHGGLLLVKRNNRYLSGILYCLQGETVWTPSMGISQENDKYNKRTASDALLYFLILWSKERGYKRLDYGNCKPFLNDGVFRYKREWQMKVQKNEKRMILAKLCNFGRGISSFLANNPFIFVDQQHLKGCVFVDHENPATEGEVAHLFKQYYTCGMSSLVLLSTSGFERKGGPKADKEIPNSLSNIFKTARKAGQDLNFLEIKERRSTPN